MRVESRLKGSVMGSVSKKSITGVECVSTEEVY